MLSQWEHHKVTYQWPEAAALHTARHNLRTTAMLLDGEDLPEVSSADNAKSAEGLVVAPDVLETYNSV